MENQYFSGDWNLNWVKAGFFPKDNLLFEKVEDQKGQYVFRFKDDGSLQQLLTPEELSDCPVGVFVMDKGSWLLEGNTLRLKFKGSKIADYEFDYEIKYAPSFSDGTMSLKVVEVVRQTEIK